MSGELTCDGEPVPLQPKVFALLHHLASRPGELVTREALTEALWPDVVVTEQSLRHVVRKARAALQQGGAEQLLETVRGRGLRFRAEVRRSEPAPSTGRSGLLGRQIEVERIAAAWATGANVVTLVGPPGAGKTRLARHVLDGEGGVFCDLTEARSAEGICLVVAEALGVPLTSTHPADQLGRALRQRRRVLLVLDNFEQVLHHAPATVGTWAAQAADARLLVTSREALRLPREHVVPVLPLALPPPHDAPAMTLFVTRAREAWPDFVLTDDNADAVAEIVTGLDGLPLAIELAAARAGVLGAREIADRLSGRFALLKREARGRRPGWDSLHAALDWSWALLAPWEQAALAQISVFRGGFSLEAAEGVVDLSPWPDVGVLDALQSLVDRHLVRVERRPGRARFDLYESIRAYGAERLGPAEPVRLRHAAWFARWSTQASAHLRSPRAVEAGAALRRELENLVAGCRWGLAAGDLASASVCCRSACAVLLRTGPVSSAVALLGEVVAVPGLSPHDRALLLRTLGIALGRHGHRDEAVKALAQALVVARAVGAPNLEATVRLELGLLESQRANADGARDHLQRALDLALQTGDATGEGDARIYLGIWCKAMGRTEAANDHLCRAAALHRQRGDARGHALALANLFGVARERGDLGEARSHGEQALSLAQALGDRRMEAEVQGNLASLEVNAGRMDAAQAGFERALALNRAIGNRNGEAHPLHGLAEVHRRVGRLEQAEASYREGLQVARAIGTRDRECALLVGLAGLLRERGDRAARAAIEEALAAARALRRPIHVAVALVERAWLELDHGQRARARTTAEQVADLVRALGTGPESELGTELSRLERALSQATAPSGEGPDPNVSNR